MVREINGFVIDEYNVHKLERVTTAINLFNCIHLNAKVKQKKYTKNLNLLSMQKYRPK